MVLFKEERILSFCIGKEFIMKKVITIFLGALLIIGATGCGNPVGAGGNTSNGGSNTGSSDNSLTGTYCGQTFTIPQPALPNSVGENPFVGKAFTVSAGNGNDTPLSTWSFTNNQATYSNTIGNITNTWTYNYTYNTENNLLYLALTEMTLQGHTINSFSSMIDYLSSISPNLSTATDERKRYFMNSIVTGDTFNKQVHQYSISGNTLNLTRYFDGFLPSNCNFSNDNINLYSGCLQSRNQMNGYACFGCTFNDGIISGTLF